MRGEEILFLNQLVKSLAEAEEKLEDAYKRGEAENFNKAKKMMLNAQKEISKIIK